MKKLFTSLLICALSQSTFSQINPVQNLLWEYEYLGVDGENYSLSWDEPENPHDELLGYNIYRNDDFYRFQVENVLFCTAEFDCNDDNGFPFYGNGESFYAHVTAIYEGEIESDYIDSVFVDEPLLIANEFKIPKLKLYPNPVQNTLRFGQKVFGISIFDLNGKLIKTISEAESIDLTHLSKGNYIIQYKNEKGEIFEDKFLKK